MRPALLAAALILGALAGAASAQQPHSPFLGRLSPASAQPSEYSGYADGFEFISSTDRSSPESAPASQAHDTYGCSCALPCESCTGHSRGCYETCEPDSLVGGCGVCGGDHHSRQNMLGDWGGARTSLSEHGIALNVEFTQFYQGVTRGDASHDWEYGGKMDYIAIVDGSKAGLWEGLSVLFHAETRYAEDLNRRISGLSPPNVNMLWPSISEEDVTAITQLAAQQMLSEVWAVTAGKYNALDLTDSIWHTGRGIDGFMNASFVVLPSLGRTTNLSILGAGMMKLRGREVEGALFVYDTNNSSTTTGVDELFDSGAVIMGVWKFFTEFGGLPGYQSFGGNWSSRKYESTDPESILIVPGQGIMPGLESGSWTLFWVGQQTLWADRCNEQRNVGVQTQFSIADEETNPIDWTASVALTANGLVPGREQDAIGVGYFYEGLAGNFKRLLAPVQPVDDTQGVEVYYNAAVTPWFHVTADLQVIEPALQSRSTATLLGMRANLDF